MQAMKEDGPKEIRREVLFLCKKHKNMSIYSGKVLKVHKITD